MSIAELLPVLQSLSRPERIQVAQFLLDGLANEETGFFQEGQVFPIHTPQFAPDAASQLARVLQEYGAES